MNDSFTGAVGARLARSYGIELNLTGGKLRGQIGGQQVEISPVGGRYAILVDGETVDHVTPQSQLPALAGAEQAAGELAAKIGQATS